jgi:hypothetical protein
MGNCEEALMQDSLCDSSRRLCSVVGKKGNVVWNCQYCTEYLGRGFRRASRTQDEVADGEVEAARSR